jgi:uncharacterized integral membrane protein (TIGR00698 family)
MMSRFKDLRPSLNGVLFVALFSLAATELSKLPWVRGIGLSPLVVGILLGMVYANTLRVQGDASQWGGGIAFSAKRILRLGVILYGFRVSFQQIGSVGLTGLAISATMVALTFGLGAFLGQRVFKLDRDTALLTAAGSSVCGAAAVMATESALGSEPHKSAVAVGTVVLFGTIAMFLYPLMYGSGVLGMGQGSYGLYVGGSVHEVAQVVAAGAAVGAEATRNAVIVKMTRVMLLAPLLLGLVLILSISAKKGKGSGGRGIAKSIPWFALLFVAASGVNSLGIVPAMAVEGINSLDGFLLTMAMTALGMETSAAKFRQAGLRPFLLALCLFAWLLGGGYAVTRLYAGL